MGRFHCMLSAAAFVGAASMAVCPAMAFGQSPVRRVASFAPPEFRTVGAVLGGAISGVVSDDRGGPLPGATVSVFGAATAVTRTDASGRFSLERLPAGEYILRAHLSGFAASRRENVRVGAAGAGIYRLQLRRLDGAVATTGRNEPLESRPIIAAGFGLPEVSDAATGTADDHSHGEIAWRLRHLTRSILKDSSNAIVIADNDDEPPSGNLFGRAMDSAASVAASLFTDLPFSGEVNLLTTGAFGPGDLMSGNALPRGVAYLSIGAPTPAGDWALRAAMSEGDLASWIVAGSFVSKRGSLHSYDLGLSYSTQEYQGGNPLALVAVTDGSRNVGEVYGLDRWTLGEGLQFEYGGRYARYDYLETRGLFSPRVGLTLEPSKGTRVKATVAQRMVAPGAEEFLAPITAGPWLPPERTFSPLGGGDLRVERTRFLDVLVEHEFNHTYVLGVRRFFQNVDDQLVTVFGLSLPGGPRSVGHYYVGSAGAVEAQGWGVRLGTSPTRHIRGSIDYSLTHAAWNTTGDNGPILRFVPAASRARFEDLHDVTSSLEADIPETATRVFLLYRVSSGYTRAGSESAPGLDGRFEMQVNQALPFGVHGTKWEVLVGVRNLFRDPNDIGSVYDELLVVRPPKRVVGGFLVKF